MLLYFSRDPGGTNQLIALYERAQEGSVPAGVGLEGPSAVLAKDHAVARWRDAGHAAEDWSSLAIPADGEARDAAIAALLEARGVTRLVTATSDVEDDTDLALWRIGAERGIPSTVILDHWANLAQRFVDRQGRRIVPELLLAPSAGVAEHLVEDGIAAERIRTVGDLHLERLARLHAVDPAARAALRAAWGAGEGSDVVLFASECVAEMAALGRPSPYDEFAAVEGLLADLAARRTLGPLALDPARTVVVLRPHPRDAAGKYDRYRREDGPRVVVSADGAADLAIASCDLVVGMDSTLLYEARALGAPVLSLIPDSRFAVSGGTCERV